MRRIDLAEISDGLCIHRKMCLRLSVLGAPCTDELAVCVVEVVWRLRPSRNSILKHCGGGRMASEITLVSIADRVERKEALSEHFSTIAESPRKFRSPQLT